MSPYILTTSNVSRMQMNNSDVQTEYDKIKFKFAEFVNELVPNLKSLSNEMNIVNVTAHKLARSSWKVIRV